MKLPYKFGRYTLLEKIANGGVAEVYRARLSADNGFAKTVAVKRLLPNCGASEELQKMLADEARVLAQLGHQAIVQALELGKSENTPFLAMEFVDGIDASRLINDLIRDRSPLSFSHALYIVCQVLSALEFAHRSVDAVGRSLNLVHRDISPSNILISWNGEVKVADFGIAKGLHRTEVTSAGQLRGKYSYMAPEQAKGERVDHRTDIFSCGIVLFELLSASRLFNSESDFEILEKVRCAKLPGGSMQKFPSELRAILMLALAADPSMRYQSAGEMLVDVQRFARSSGNLSSCFEFAAYLKEKYPLDSQAKRSDVDLSLQKGEPTKVLGENSPLPPMGEGDRSEFVIPERLSRGSTLSKHLRTAAIGALLLGVTFFQPTRDSGAVTAVISATTNEHQIVSEKIDRTIEKEIPVKNFEPKKVSQGAISIHARPWGLVDIPGIISGRETPVGTVKVKAGEYAIRVRFPPAKQVVLANVSIADGESKRCMASFGARAMIKCR